MPKLPSLGQSPALGDVLRQYPAGVDSLLAYHDALLRGPSPLTVGEREMIAAYVSTLNSCRFCAGAHRVIAEVHGVPAELLDALLDPDAEFPLGAHWRPLLAYVRKLTEAPARVTDGDAAAALAAGWSEEAVFHAISVCALFNLMNRLVEGCGVTTDMERIAGQRERHLQSAGDPETYLNYGRQLGVVK